MRRLFIAAAVLVATIYLTGKFPIDIEAACLNRFGLDILKLED